MILRFLLLFVYNTSSLAQTLKHLSPYLSFNMDFSSSDDGFDGFSSPDDDFRSDGEGGDGACYSPALESLFQGRVTMVRYLFLINSQPHCRSRPQLEHKREDG